MHELSLCESIRQIVEQQAVAQGFTRVIRIRLKVGTLACVDARALRFGFAAVMPGSPAEGAELEIIQTPGRAWCFDCCQEVVIHTRLDECQYCGGVRLRATAGEELQIKNMEVR